MGSDSDALRPSFEAEDSQRAVTAQLGDFYCGIMLMEGCLVRMKTEYDKILLLLHLLDNLWYSFEQVPN